MWLNDNLIKFIESSSEITKTTIYLSDLKKIKIGASPNKGCKRIEKIISRELLENLLVIGTGIEQDKYIFIDSEENIIPIFDDKALELNIPSQIILPLWTDNELKGTLIIVGQNRKLDDYDLELAKSVQLFVEESILNSINDEFLDKKGPKKVKPKIIPNIEVENEEADHLDM